MTLSAIAIISLALIAVSLGFGFFAALCGLGQQEKLHHRRLARAKGTSYGEGYADALRAVNAEREAAEDALIAAIHAGDRAAGNPPRGVLEPAPPIDLFTTKEAANRINRPAA